MAFLESEFYALFENDKIKSEKNISIFAQFPPQLYQLKNSIII